VILDASASMQATDESPSRFEKARAEALKWVTASRTRRDGDRAGGRDDGGQAIRDERESGVAARAAGLRLFGWADRLIPALKMAESLVRDLDPKTGPEIHLFSDGAVPELNEFENKACRWFITGGKPRTTSHYALDVRANPRMPPTRDLRERGQLLSEARQTELELLLDDRLLETRPLTIPEGQTSPQVFKATQRATASSRSV